MSGFQDVLKNSQKLHEVFKHTQTEISNLQVTGVAGAGMVIVNMNGRYQVLQIIIEDDAWLEGKGFVEELTAAATNDAIGKIQEASQHKMSRFASILSAGSSFAHESLN